MREFDAEWRTQREIAKLQPGWTTVSAKKIPLQPVLSGRVKTSQGFLGKSWGAYSRSEISVWWGTVR